ncbi:OLC1v1004879C1 [Oldenlandia corymbosa var. corymbosa]|uniref:OLC1v1004879C1 n=1 Tax=Oldenlandia corymbosa var. corymbosa TaxID=529605 RepID=A0AAV1DDB3_OLDCO|nr:OLC1v1004879C1 [Oldenlandia corymbosa var. corymbosa]
MAPHSQAPSPSKGKGKVKEYFTWTPEMDKVLGECFIEQMKQGKKLDGKCAWKNTSWTAAINALADKLQVRVDKKKILSRLKTWEKHYETLQPLLVSCNSGSAITWDYSKGRVEVHDENVWNERVEANPKLAPYRRKIIVENWEEICTIFSQDRANGQGGHTLREMNAEETVGESVNLGDPFETCEEDEIMRLMMGYQKRKEAASSSTFQGMNKKPSSSNIMCGFMKQIAENFGEFMVTERQILVATKKSYTGRYT